MACFYFVGFILALYPPETLGTNVVSESYEVQAIPVDPSFSSHFAPLQPQQQQQQPTGDEKLLYEQQQYLNKLYICHKAKSESGQKCHYATICQGTALFNLCAPVVLLRPSGLSYARP